ncbi:oxidoreductase-like domain-containing protein [Iodobacter arcticus]|uniref:Oxidoreductase-like domain-containing protein n=1 Tax=Iodobacter arcticus TaxID=590593 RepID=A0ABW2QUZ9_9NEIS
MLPLDNQFENDPPPTAPIEPEFESCCGSGCGDSCVFDIYYVLRAQYLADYAAWQARQAAQKEKPL